MGIENTINKRYSRLLLHYPWSVIICMSSCALLFTILGFVLTDLPDFSDPSKGFFARGSGTMTGKLLILQELVEKVKRSMNVKESVQNQPTLNIEYKCEDDSQDPILKQNDDEECIFIADKEQGRTHWPALHVDSFQGECLMSSKQFKLFFSNYDEIFNQTAKFHKCTNVPDIHSAYEFYFAVKDYRSISFTTVLRDLCSVDIAIHKQLDNCPVIDNAQPCHYSLASLAADLFNHSNCSQLSTEELKSFSIILQQCLPFATSGLLYHLQEGRAYAAYASICDQICFSPAMSFALNSGVDKYFDGSSIRKVSVWIPVARNVTRLAAHQQAVLEFRKLHKFQQHGSLQLEAVNMFNSRIFTAMQSIRHDMYLVVLAVCAILLISLLYTRSIVVCLITVYNVVLALGCAYTTYQLIMRISIFPYINLMGFFLLVGLSCDNVFVFDDIWLKELHRSAETDKEIQSVSASATSSVTGGCSQQQIKDPLSAIGRTLRHASIALFITSCTTSAAFLTNLCSKIVYIQMFGLYLGLSIIFLFLVSVTILPAALIITHQGTSSKRNESLTLHGLMADSKVPNNSTNSASHDKAMLSTRPTVNLRVWYWIKRIRDKINIRSIKCSCRKNNSSPTVKRNRINNLSLKVERFYNIIENAIFRKFLPQFIINHTKVLPTMLALFGLVGLIAVFVWPKMKFPEDTKHRFFSNHKHFMEYFEFNVRDDIRLYHDTNQDQIMFPQFIFILGVSSADNVKFLNPTSKPIIQASTPPLNIFDPLTIIWLDEFVCRFLNSSLFIEFNVLHKQWNIYRALLANSVEENQSNESSVFCSHRDGKCFGPSYRIKQKFRRIRDGIRKQSSMLISNSPHQSQNLAKDLRIFFHEENDFHALAFIVRANATFNHYTTTIQYADSLDSSLKRFKMNIPNDMYEIWYASRTMALFDMHRLIGRGTFQSLISAVIIVTMALLFTTANLLMTVLSLLSITFILADTIAVFVLSGWTLNFMETIIIITAVGLSVDFTVHYGVAFLHAPEDTGQRLTLLSERCSCCQGDHQLNDSETQSIRSKSSQKSKKEANLRACIERVGPAVFMSAFTTFLAGLSMCPSKLTAFSQMGFFLMLIMVISWIYATLFFLPLCLIFGPTQHWGTIKLKNCFACIRSKLKCRQ